MPGMIRRALVPCLTLVMAACSTVPSPAPDRPEPSVPRPQAPAPRPAPLPAPPPPAPADGFRMPEIMRGPGLDGVIREDARSLIRQFGPPRLDVREGDMRKLQFAGAPCVLDIFLYPLSPGAEPVATWLDARRASDGAGVDLLACLTALRRDVSERDTNRG